MSSKLKAVLVKLTEVEAERLRFCGSGFLSLQED